MERFDLDRLLLTFRDPEVERGYRERIFASSLFFTRLYLFAGLVLYSVFGVLDSLLAEPLRDALLGIRFLFVIPVIALVFGLSFLPLFRRHVETALVVALTASGLGIIMMVSVLPEQLASQYYAGLIMVVIYAGSVPTMRFPVALGVTFGLVGAYQVASIFINPIGLYQLVSNNFFLVMSAGIGLFTSYVLETQSRANFVAQKIIEEKNSTMQVLLDRAEAANRAKGEFLANMSHELRTPLNAIIGFSEMIRQQYLGPVGSPKYRDYASDIHDSGRHLLSIINDILDLARAEAGKLEIREARFDFDEMVRSTVKLFQHRAGQARVELSLILQESGLAVRGEERLLQQVMSNLISNAIKFTPPGGRIVVTMSITAKDGVRLQVKDNGIGIASENIERVLRPFEQVESAHARLHNGAGLGLPFAKKVIELHGGRLVLDSALDAGTSVRFMLPASRVCADDAPDEGAVTAARF